MAAPGDDGRVITAMRLGWCIAEVRGRNRPDAPQGAKAALPGPASLALPLHIEQTPTELRIQTQSELATMAGRLGVDERNGQPNYSAAIDDQAEKLANARAAAGGGTAVGGAATGAAPAAGAATAAGSTGGAASAVAGGGAGMAADGPVAGAVDAAPAAPPAPLPAVSPAANGAADDPTTQWNLLQELIFHFDQHVQDTLASESDTVAAGYQLGRALAEPYWALEPDLPQNTKSPAAWWFLLGAERCSEMSRLAGRLSAYFHPLTAAAIAGSVQIWKHVAADPTWRKNADYHLYLQIRRWYELVVMGQDPTTLVQPYALIRNFRMAIRALRIFWPELIVAAVSALALSGFAVAIGEHNINSFLKSALGFIAIFGFSIAGLTARLKNQAQEMVKRLRQDVYTDLVAVAITTAPTLPSVPNRPAKQNAKLEAMARERSITPVTPS